jgi:hypothetical protein
VILEDDEPNCPDADAEDASASASIDAGADSAFEPSKPTNPSAHELWYDVEDGRFVEEDLCPILPLEQEGSASTPTLAQDYYYPPHYSPRPSRHQIGYDSDGNTQRTSEEPARHSLPTTVDEDRGGRRDENTSELGKDFLLTLEGQEKTSSATAPSSPRPRYHSAEPSQPQIGPGHDQSGTGYVRLEEPRRGSPLRSQYQEQELQEQQRQKVAAKAMREVSRA